MLSTRATTGKENLSTDADHGGQVCNAECECAVRHEMVDEVVLPEVVYLRNKAFTDAAVKVKELASRNNTEKGNGLVGREESE